MSDYRPPSPDDLNKTQMLIRQLREVHSEMRKINDETERFSTLLEQLGEVIKEHRWEFADLQSTVLDYENDLNRVKSIKLPEQPKNKVDGQATSITSEDRKPGKEEG